MKMNKLVKLARAEARKNGKRAAEAINNAIYPVFESDGELWTEIAVSYARHAWRFAEASSPQKRKDKEQG
jgi:hypothetical protein